MKIFISGSSKIKKLNQEMTNCLDELIKQPNNEVIVGDCYGVDILVQKYLKEHGYTNVTVYCSQKTPRRTEYNNYISMYEQAKNLNGEDFYQVKDKEMCNQCDSAIAFWNGTSYGVKCNIERIQQMNKPLTIIYE